VFKNTKIQEKNTMQQVIPEIFHRHFDSFLDSRQKESKNRFLLHRFLDRIASGMALDDKLPVYRLNWEDVFETVWESYLEVMEVEILAPAI
jgi:hypothetical protein